MLPKRCTRKIARSILKQLATRPRAIAKTAAYVQQKKVEMLFAHLKRIQRLDRCVCGSERGEGRKARVRGGLRYLGNVRGSIVEKGKRGRALVDWVRVRLPQQVAQDCRQRFMSVAPNNMPPMTRKAGIPTSISGAGTG